MPLPMQGKKLIPGHHNVGGCCIRPCAPDRRHRDRALDAQNQLANATTGELATHRLTVRGALMRRNVEERGLDLLGVGVTKLNACKCFQMLVEQPGMIDGGLQNERLPARDRSAMAAQDRACGKLRAGDDVGPFDRASGARASSEWRIASRGRIAAALFAPIPHSPFAIRYS